MSKNFSELYTNLARMLPIGLRSHVVNETHWVSPLVRAFVENQAQLLDRIELLEKTLKEYNILPHVIKKFESMDWFKVSGRGWVCGVKVDQDFYTNDVLNKEVYIDEKLYFVVGIESFAKYRTSDPIRGNLFNSNDSIGLLIRGEK